MSVMIRTNCYHYKLKKIYIYVYQIFFLMEYSDQKLISAVQNGDLRAYEDLYKKYYVYLCYVAEHIIRSHADAEEIVSDVRIVFESERLKSYRFTGIILAEPIEQVLEVMSITAPINFRLKGNVVTLSENKDFIEVNKDLYVKPKQSNLKTLLPMENTRGI